MDSSFHQLVTRRKVNKMSSVIAQIGAGREFAMFGAILGRFYLSLHLTFDLSVARTCDADVWSAVSNCEDCGSIVDSSPTQMSKFFRRSIPPSLSPPLPPFLVFIISPLSLSVSFLIFINFHISLLLSPSLFRSNLSFLSVSYRRTAHSWMQISQEWWIRINEAKKRNLVKKNKLQRDERIPTRFRRKYKNNPRPHALWRGNLNEAYEKEKTTKNLSKWGAWNRHAIDTCRRNEATDFWNFETMLQKRMRSDVSRYCLKLYLTGKTKIS